MRRYYERNVVRILRLRGLELLVYGTTAHERGTYVNPTGPPDLDGAASPRPGTPNRYARI